MYVNLSVDVCIIWSKRFSAAVARVTFTLVLMDLYHIEVTLLECGIAMEELQARYRRTDLHW